MKEQELKTVTMDFMDTVRSGLVVAEIEEGIQVAVKGNVTDVTSLICTAIRRIMQNLNEHDQMVVKLVVMGLLNGKLEELGKAVDALEGELIYEAKEDER